MKIQQWEPPCSMRTEGWTDGQKQARRVMKKLEVAFHSFTKASKNSEFLETIVLKDLRGFSD